MPLALAILTLTLFGWVMVASLSGPSSYDRYTKIYKKPCPVEEVNCNSYFMWQHFYHMLIGLTVLVVTTSIPYRIWAKSSLALFIVAYALLMMTLISPWGVDHNTFAKNWLDFPFLPAFQPVEIAKIFLILYLAHWMGRRTEQIQTLKNGFVPFAILTSIVVIPVVAQPDFGSALVVAVVAASIYFLAGARISHLVLGTLIVMSLVSILFSFYPHLQKRFYARFTPVENCQTDACWQSYQSLIAVGTGGWTGLGYNGSRQKHNWLPEIKSDYIFAGISEELGFIRTLFILFLFSFIVYRSYLVAESAPDRFARLASMGIVVMLTMQAFLHIAVNLDLLPVTGVTLPLLSSGGSSLITTLFAFGILLNISTHASKNASYFSRRRRLGRPRAA